jgi:hypothetical protein
VEHASLEFDKLQELPILGGSWVRATFVTAIGGLVLLPVLLCLLLPSGRIHERSSFSEK